MPGELVELNNKILVKNPSCQIVLMTSSRIDQYINGIKNCVRIPHIISRDSEDRIFTIKNILTSVTKLASSDIFGLNKYLSWGTEILSESVINSYQRFDLIKKVNQHFEKLGVRNSIRDRSDLVLDELLMNAIYDAPVDDHGTHLHNHLSRTEVIELNRNQYSTLRYATDGLFLAISVEDPFGSLKGDVLLRYLERCYLGEVTGHLDGEKKGGGGRGLHQILENSDLVVFNIHQDHRTEVICFLYVDPKQLGTKLPSFHLFFQGL